MCGSNKVSYLPIGIFLVTLGLIGFLWFPQLYWKIVYQKLILSPESEMYPFWKDLPIPMYLKVYFFNITNSLEVVNGKMPILEQIGPYIYREERHKENISWNNNGTASYQQVKRWYFEPELTNGSLEDAVVTLNVPMVTAVKIATDELPDWLPMVSSFLSMTNSSLIIKKTARQLLFNGYRDKLLDLAYLIKLSPWKKFGWFYKRNNSIDGLFTIFTGQTGMKHFGCIDKWNGLKKVNSWKSFCNEINGSGGDLWPPMTKRAEKITLFSPDICRSLSLYSLEENEVKGINTIRYYGNKKTIDNGRLYPEDKCFDTKEHVPQGALDVSKCKLDAPVVVSYPHFLYADPIYLADVTGLKPDYTLHQTYVDIVPKVGVPMNVAVKLQINLILENIPKIRQFSELQNRTYFPVIWFEETGVISDEIAKQMKFISWEILYIVKVCSVFLLAFGSTFIAYASILLIFKFKRNHQYKSLQNYEEYSQ